MEIACKTVKVIVWLPPVKTHRISINLSSQEQVRGTQDLSVYTSQSLKGDDITSQLCRGVTHAFDLCVPLLPAQYLQTNDSKAISGHSLLEGHVNPWHPTGRRALGNTMQGENLVLQWTALLLYHFVLLLPNNRQISSKVCGDELKTVAISYRIPWAPWWSRCISDQLCSCEGSLGTTRPPLILCTGLHRVLQTKPAEKCELCVWGCGCRDRWAR